VNEERVVVCAAPKDARLTAEFLSAAGVPCTATTGWQDARLALQEGAGALLVGGELLTPDVLGQLEDYLDRQPPWSDLPIVIVLPLDYDERTARFDRLGNLSMLQRPLSLDTLRSTVRAALRARRRQYQVRALLQQRDETNRRKDEFLAMLAHELRNPLAPLRIGLQLLQQHPSADVVARTYAMMDRQIAHISRLVDDLLDVSRLTRGKITLQKTAVDLGECVKEAADSFAPIAQRNGLTISTEVPEGLVLDADRVRIEQMIGNLLSNALKFTPSGGHVTIAARQENGEVALEVRDTGVGIPPDQLPFVFELFAQTTRALDRSDGGLGIGLTVVRLIAELHGGSATIQSEGDGRGTTVTVRLPLGATRPAVAPRPAERRSATGLPQRVLIIEDNHDAANTLGMYLRAAGHDVHVSYDGLSGLRAAFELRPSVIVCDIGLPAMDGYQIARCVRAAPDLSGGLLIAVTGYGEPAARERAREAGFDHYLTKPIDAAALTDLVGARPSAA
jgi:two-component system, sensor histidine kinase